jgi:hypothetical protein
MEYQLLWNVFSYTGNELAVIRKIEKETVELLKKPLKSFMIAVIP